VRFLLVLLLLFALGCGGEEVAIKVEGLSLSMEEFQKELRSLVGKEALPPQELRELKAALVEELIERMLILREANRRGLEVSDQDVQEFLQGVKDAGEDLKGHVKELLLRAKLFESMAAEVPPPSEEELKAYYEEHKEEFRLPERVKVRQIVLASLQEAKEVRNRLKRGASFTELARRRSIAPEAPQGGYLGFVSREEVPEEFEVVFKLKVGRISPIVKSPYGYHIFLVEERRAGRTLKYEEVKGEMEARLEYERLQQTWRRWLERQRQSVRIEVNERIFQEAGG